MKAKKKSKNRSRRWEMTFDRPLFFAIILLLAVGLIMIASAGVFYGRARFGDAYYFLKEQLLGLGAGMIVLFFFQSISYHKWRAWVVPVFLVALLLLVLVFIPGIGTTVYGAARWIQLGPLSFQPSEVMKLAIILYLSAWLSSKGREKTADFFEGFFPAHWDPKLRIPRGQVVAAASIVSPKY